MRWPWSKKEPHRCRIATPWRMELLGPGTGMDVGSCSIIGVSVDGSLRIEASGVAQVAGTFDRARVVAGDVAFPTPMEPMTLMGCERITVTLSIRLESCPEPALTPGTEGP